MSSRAQNAFGRLQLNGVRGVSVPDLIAVGVSRREDDIEANESEALSLLRKYETVRGFEDVAARDLKDFFGLEGFEAHRCLSLIELGRRAAGVGRGEIKYVETPEDAYALLDEYRKRKKEFFLAILLDSKNALMRVAEIHVGTLTMSVVGPREVFREAVRDSASAIIVAHNHPSGDPTPSPEDLAVTERLKQVGELLDIPVVDHLIIGERYAWSVMSRRRVGR